MQIIPSIDLRNGQCVRLLHGDYDKQTDYDVTPVGQAAHYTSLGLGALHIVDLDGALDGGPANLDVIREMIGVTSGTVQVGGGIREDAHVQALLDAGATRVVVGSLAVRDPGRVRDWMGRFGGDAIVLALDVRVGDDGVARVCTDAWRHTSNAELVDTIRAFRTAGLRHVLCTDIGRDGALSGPATDLYAALLDACPFIELQASGGVASIDDLRTLRDAGLHAAITGKALLEGRITDEELRQF